MAISDFPWTIWWLKCMEFSLFSGAYCTNKKRFFGPIKPSLYFEIFNIGKSLYTKITFSGILK